MFSGRHCHLDPYQSVINSKVFGTILTPLSEVELFSTFFLSVYITYKHGPHKIIIKPFFQAVYEGMCVVGSTVVLYDGVVIVRMFGTKEKKWVFFPVEHTKPTVLTPFKICSCSGSPLDYTMYDNDSGH